MLEYPGRDAISARVTLEVRGKRERTLRAGRTLTACWGLALVAVFLPLLHFVLVPGLLLLGPLLAWSRLHEECTLLSVDGTCPACASPVHEKLGRAWRERVLMRCGGCSRPLTLVLRPPEQGRGVQEPPPISELEPRD